jgi:4a-hydroxytetrahydrobiopterin dehydratase
MGCMSLSHEQIEHRLQRLQGWSLDATIPCIQKAWTFDRFESAVAFFNRVAELAAAQDHHPEVWSSHVRLRIRLWTHDTGGLTDKDFELAEAIDLLDPSHSDVQVLGKPG